ncbi:MAG: hypothetical protein HC869_27160 [Rhodospirillales bacterium]|nr:hypothetical protein [Rhodospirillales bacterium]
MMQANLETLGSLERRLSVTLPLDETEYTYPIVDIKNLHVWTKDEEGSTRIRPYIGFGHYWGPYWSPYWRPWPYW